MLFVHILLALIVVLLFISLLCFIDLSTRIITDEIANGNGMRETDYKNKLTLVSNASFAIAITLMAIAIVYYHGVVI